MIAEIEKQSIDKFSYRLHLKHLSDYLFVKYKLLVLESEIIDSNEYVGSYDGKTIFLKSKLSDEHKLFLAAHLFGHTIQWCYNTAKYSNIEETLPNNNEECLTAEQLNELKFYEYEAAGYAIKLLNDALKIDLAQWFSDWSNADWDYLINISHLIDKSKNVEIVLKHNSEVIFEKQIPIIQLTKFKKKYAY